MRWVAVPRRRYRRRDGAIGPLSLPVVVVLILIGLVGGLLQSREGRGLLALAALVAMGLPVRSIVRSVQRRRARARAAAEWLAFSAQ